MFVKSFMEFRDICLMLLIHFCEAPLVEFFPHKIYKFLHYIVLYFVFSKAICFADFDIQRIWDEPYYYRFIPALLDNVEQGQLNSEYRVSRSKSTKDIHFNSNSNVQ